MRTRRKRFCGITTQNICAVLNEGPLEMQDMTLHDTKLQEITSVHFTTYVSLFSLIVLSKQGRRWMFLQLTILEEGRERKFELLWGCGANPQKLNKHCRLYMLEKNFVRLTSCQNVDIYTSWVENPSLHTGYIRIPLRTFVDERIVLHYIYFYIYIKYKYNEIVKTYMQSWLFQMSKTVESIAKANAVNLPNVCSPPFLHSASIQ